MNILQINTNDYSGGAARAMYRLHQGLLGSGVNSRILALNKVLNDPSIIQYRPPESAYRNIVMRWRTRMDLRHFRGYRNRPRECELFSLDRTPYSVSIQQNLAQTDILHLHWIAGFIDYTDYFWNVRGKIPMVWTLHDMNPFTGGCHYNEGCDRFLQGCGSCPQLGSNSSIDLSHQIWRRKQAAYRGLSSGQLTIVTPSRWLASEAGRSSLLGTFKTHVIPNGIDTNKFAPRDRRMAREILGLPLDSKIVLFVADSAANRRKGFDLLRQALEGLPPSFKVSLAYVGGAQAVIDMRFPQRYLGSVSDERLLSFIYSAADVFVIPSLEDNLPNTVMESMACGTPVVGFGIGGVADMVRHGSTGLTVPARDHAALGEAIRELISDPERRGMMSTQCRRVAVDEYSMEVQARNYLALYQKILHTSNLTPK